MNKRHKNYTSIYILKTKKIVLPSDYVFMKIIFFQFSCDANKVDQFLVPINTTNCTFDAASFVHTSVFLLMLILYSGQITINSVDSC